MKKSNQKLIIVIALLALVGLVCFFFVEPNKKQEEVVEPIVEEEIPEKVINEDWLKNKAINDDYVCQVTFNSNIIDLPVVQAKGEITDYKFYAFNSGKPVTNYASGCESGACGLNDVYLRMNWEDMSYELGGTPFLDYRNKLDDQNLIIYGHLYPKSMDKDRKLFFSALDLLLDEENYEANKDLYLTFEDEIRHYQVAYVYLFNLTNDDYDNLQYYRTNYNYDYYGQYDGYYKKYIENLKEARKYDTGIELTTDDNTLTLQTCYDGSGNYVEIVVCKQVDE